MYSGIVSYWRLFSSELFQKKIEAQKKEGRTIQPQNLHENQVSILPALKYISTIMTQKLEFNFNMLKKAHETRSIFSGSYK